MGLGACLWQVQSFAEIAVAQEFSQHAARDALLYLLEICFYLCASVYVCICVNVCHTYSGADRSQERVSDPPRLKFQQLCAAQCGC